MKLFSSRLAPVIGLISIAGQINDERATNILLSLRTIPSMNCQVRAVIVRISSSGGSLGSAQSIVEGIDLLKQELDIPVVVTVSEMATSAAFYIALSATKLIATQAATLGNMGAIIRNIDPEKFLEKLGINYQAIASGIFKDSLSNFSSLSTEQRRELSELVQELSRQFAEHVEVRRPQCTRRDELMNGQVFSGATALDHGLLDKLGGFYTAVQECELLTGISGMSIRLLETEPARGTSIALSVLGALLNK